MALPRRAGAVGNQEVLTGNLQFFTLFTSLDITQTGNYADNTQKDLESVIQVIALRAMPVIMNDPVELDGVGQNVLENYGAPTLTGAGWILKFSFEREEMHTVSSLVEELHNVVLNAGTIDTKTVVNMEFTRQELI